MLTFGRDYTQSVAQIRSLEADSPSPLHNDDAMLGWPEYQTGRVALVFATLFVSPMRFCGGGWDPLCYADASQANRLYRYQLDVYERLVDDHPDKFRLVHTRRDLQELLADWQKPAEPANENEKSQAGHPVGLIILMEGAEGVRHPAELEEWWRRGLRIIGPAWAGTRFCGGTKEPGPLTAEGFALLEGMASVGFSLDLTHMDEQAALQALDVYPGQIIATHSNALALLNGSDSNRHLSERLIHGLLERDGVIGVVPFNSFLKAGWKRGDRREEVDIQSLIAQIDYICQMAGDAQHVGIGSDFDGGFGLQSVPIGIDSVADLQKMAPFLGEKGYSMEDITAILGGNWLSRIRQILPDSL
jgi:membrane dipeptidase